MTFKAIGFDYNGVISDGNSVDDHILDLADKLRLNGYKTAILSNFGRSGADMINAEGTAGHFDVIHVSGVTGFSKPQPEAFKLLAESLGLDITELVYIDDSPYNLSTASKTGFTPLLFEGYEKLLSDLKILGIILY